MCKDKQDQQERKCVSGIEDLEIDPHLYGNCLLTSYKAN